MTKVAVVDDHGVVLAGLKFVLSRAEGMEVVATAESAEDILGFYENAKPDVLLLVVSMATFASGCDFRSVSSASSPLTDGILMSSSRTSGLAFS